jgi:glycosyltransferase involved in cell wall biosynthesis
VGYADVEKRKRLMAGAKGLFCPTIYNEPFGYVAIEAMLSGTPVITVDWGAFTETVQHGVTGFRCRTFEQFVWAAKNIDTISPRACREWAEENYNFKKIGGMYKEYFESIINVSKGTGWYTENDSRTELDWLTKIHPKLD